ncbi:uncharacterized protein LOC9653488 [Selaginella moellendorffii]|uniref:uncharacterized protein LOC9653488 n=1 Tax=Selaginella moellendorffii TaxID=88036 RepID=UPI000D1C60CA|nr:uncharacterized protein LOC9653488 [Selaginella moellendorffii]|eukprot:XP_024515408.1 uncharacterized protein LOC9653488 [Selaginella moellendorffii]
MSLVVMEEQSQPVFRDFLGSSAAPNPETKQPELSATDSVRVSQNSGFMEQEDGEASVRGGSTFSAPCPSSAPGPSFPASSDPGTELWRHGKAPAGMPFSHAIKAANCVNDDVTRKREELANRAAFRENDMMEGSRPSKASRFKQRENETLPSTGDFGLTMQPPRTSQAGGNLWLQTSVFNPSTGTSKRIESSRPTSGVPMLARPMQATSGATAGATAGGVFSRNPASSILPPPADEGSRTGLQGGGIAALINSANAKLPSARPLAEPPALERTASLDRPKPPLQNGGSDSLLPSHKTSTTSATRQLTIFYGGHAHVFDDVSPEKADAIMQMAGSNGRSWSTTYAHRSSRSEGSLADLRREKAAIGATSLTVPSENQNAPSNLQRKHRIPPDHHTVKVGIPGDVPVPSGIPIGDGNRFAMANGRAPAGLHGSFYNMKETASNGQHWL